MWRSNDARFVARGLLALGFLLSAGPVWAEAGRVMYASGQATLIRGGEIPVTKGLAVEAGDTLVTGADGRIQLLMADGDRIALRPDSRFAIDEFSGPSRVRPDQPVAGTRPSSWRSFYTLAKGGFRTLTQSLGQRDSSSYQVKTPVATIGIRGTDYTLLYCPEGCAAYKARAISRNEVRVEGMHASVFRDSAGSRLLFAALGLSWVQDFLRAEEGGGGSNGGQGELLGGVSSGEIDVTDSGGNTNTVGDNQYFQASDQGFQQLPEAPEGLNDSNESDGEGQYQEQVGDSGGEGEGESEEFSARTDPIEGDGTGEGGTGTGDGAVGDVTMEFGTADTGSTSPSEPPAQDITTDSGGSLTGGTAPPPSSPPDRPAAGASEMESIAVSNVSVLTDGSGAATRFSYHEPDGSGFTTLDIGTAQNANHGKDLSSNTGLQWGRWTGGTATETFDDGVSTPARMSNDLTNSSMHWIYGETAPVTGIEGSYTYQLIGNTDPTDNQGHTGTLGAATFSADFTNQEVFSSIGINNLDNQSWSASGSGNFSQTQPGTFGGDYSSFGGTACPSASCGGSFAGFFSGDGGGGPPHGAGLAYELSNGTDEVNGTAAFGNPQSTPPP